jgi:anti-sigma regulatory factor (Ser/Thr protein kinase)
MARAQIRFVADEGTIARVTGWFERFCQQHGLSRDVINAVSLSLEEIVSNIVVHSYERQPGKLLIELYYDRRAFSVVIEDRGQTVRSDAGRDPTY